LLENRPQLTGNSILVQSSRLLLRQPEEKDLPVFQSIFCDDRMMHYLGGAWTADQTAAALQEWRADWGVQHRWHGPLVCKDTLEMVGTAGLSLDTISDEPGLELSWFVLPGQQGQGFATEISRALVGFAFNNLLAERVLAETHPENAGALRVLAKLGFTCRGVQQHRYDFLPGFDTQTLWELTRAAWLQRGGTN
jgi:RimJ/RimL family protein N-acetyltransferase